MNNISVVMVTGSSSWGGERPGARTSVELLSINGTRLCALPSLPENKFFHTLSGLVTCGGGQPPNTDQKSCFTFSGGNWKKTHTLRQLRYGATSWASPRGVLIMGGTHQETTTELLNGAGASTASFNLKNRIQ